MKTLLLPGIIACLFFICLTACAVKPSPAAPPEEGPTQVQTPTERPDEGPTQVQTTPMPAEETFSVGDARFIQRELAIEAAESVAVAAADFDGDGNLDLVASGEPDLVLFRGDGQGGFDISQRVPGGLQPVDFGLADLDADGDIDVVIANHDTTNLTLLLGDGSGFFEPAPHSPLSIPVAPHPHAVLAEDFDQDGYTDLVVDHRQGEGLLILRGLGDGSFESPGTVVGVGGDPYRGMAAGDIDGDGWLDLITPNPGEVGTLINISGGGPAAFEPGEPLHAEAPFAVALGDFNGDGRLDVIAASDEGSPLVELVLGDGAGGFHEAAGSPIQFAPGGKMIAVGDFNGDGVDDAAVAAWPSTDVLVLLGGEEFRTGYLPGGEHPWGMAAADFNRDGRDDLVIADDNAPRALVYLSLNP
ncbi:MAG: VCBS repeat-containing protein [Anaerolineales bacterium]|nr:VCBS repeat-containing protein [Anaerolineales bacterium]